MSSHQFTCHALGLRTRVIEEGPAERDEAVVFLHGAPGSAEAWSDLLPRVGRFARAVAFDLPGFGECERPATWDYSHGGYASFVAAAINELGIEQAHLVMHDIGSAGCMWAAAHPEQFASAVLIDAGIPIDYSWHTVARLHRAPLVGRAAVPLGGMALPGTMRLFERAPRRLPRAQIRTWRREYDCGSRRALLRFYRASEAGALEPVAGALRQLDRPALVVWGAHDPFVPVEQAERQRECFPSAEVVVLPDSGHYPHLDDPQRVAELVVPFLRDQLRRVRLR